MRLNAGGRQHRRVIEWGVVYQGKVRMSMDAVLEQLRESQKLNVVFAQPQRIGREEQARRAQFYATLREDEKSEFINGEAVVQSPVKLRHNLASQHLAMLLCGYARKHGLERVGHEKLPIARQRNDYALFFGPSWVRNYTVRSDS